MADWYGQQPQQRNNSVMAVPVQGEVGAQNYLVAAGNTVLLTDFNEGFIWLKSTDVNAMFQSMRKFKVEEITPQPKQDKNFIQRAEFEQFQQNINSQLQQVLEYLTRAGGKEYESSNTVVKKREPVATESE